MPIPELTGDLTEAEIIEKYEEFGWHKQIEFDWVEADPRRVGGYILKKYIYTADSMPCLQGDDAQFRLTFVQFMATGAYWTCAMCRKTYGPLTYEDGRLVSTEEITLDEAWDVIVRTNQQRPIGMQERKGAGFRVLR